LHRAKKVMVKVWDVDCLVDDQVERPPCRGVSVSNHTTHGPISLASERLVISHDGHRSIVVQNKTGMPA
jgi:hypothetical protein